MPPPGKGPPGSPSSRGGFSVRNGVRIDRHIEVQAAKVRDITVERASETSAQVRDWVIAARRHQQERFRTKPKN